MVAIKAQYTEAILPEHKNNPLIEALPSKLSWEKVMDFFSNYPEYAEEIAAHPDPLVREEYLNRIDELRQPLTEYEPCFRAIERAIKKGYSTKNPLTPTGAQYLHYSVDERPSIEPKTGFFQPKGEGLTLVGESGIGKTCMLEQILGYFPQVIKHTSYNGNDLGGMVQLVWIKVDCPNNSSVRDLCEEILASIDLVLDREKTRPEKAIGSLIRQLEQHMKLNNLGMLVIDEMQNLKFKRTGGEDNLLKFLHRLVNKLGIPMFFIANPPFDETLIKELKAARRAESAYNESMRALSKDSESWWGFIEQLWNYQWTNVYTELTDELNAALHNLSVGNLDMASRTYREAQRALIGSEDERITVASLETGYRIACGLSRKTSEVVELKRTLPLPRGKKRKSLEQSLKTEYIIDKTGDISKPQHSEFASKLVDLMNCVDLLNQINDPDLFQQAMEHDDPISYFTKKSYLMSDPLNELS